MVEHVLFAVSVVLLLKLSLRNRVLQNRITELQTAANRKSVDTSPQAAIADYRSNLLVERELTRLRGAIASARGRGFDIVKIGTFHAGHHPELGMVTVSPEFVPGRGRIWTYTGPIQKIVSRLAAEGHKVSVQPDPLPRPFGNIGCDVWVSVR